MCVRGRVFSPHPWDFDEIPDDILLSIDRCITINMCPKRC